MRKEDTPERLKKRKYEERHKDERKAQYKVWGTSIDRKFADEIDEFLAGHPNLSKVAIIVEGYKALKERCENDEKESGGDNGTER